MGARRRITTFVMGLALAVPAVAEADSEDKHSKLSEQVTITRDSHGEPHIVGDSAPATLYGFGYAQMQDQATFVLSNLATSTGRSAELLGPDCQPSLAACFRTDQLTHLFRVPESAEAKFDTLPAESRARFEAFADGINAYIDRHPDAVPAWAEHVNAEDVLASVQFRFVLAQVSDAAGVADPSGSVNTDSRLAPRSMAGPATGAGAVDLGASNAFAVAGSKTASGKPILEGNPHLPFDGTSRWYVAELEYPGNRIAGATFRGLPGIALGSNGHVAWSNTANHGTQNETDTYVERLNPANPNQYLYGGSYRDMEVDHGTVKVQTSPGSVRSVSVTYRYTIHGPVLSDPAASVDGTQPAPAANVAVSATVSQFEQVGLGTQLWKQGEARSLGEFKRALAQDQLSGFNVVAADESDIFYVGGSRSGILAPGLNPDAPLDGTNPAATWQGILPFAQLPQATNPPSGYYQNANNAPSFSAPDQISEASLPYYLQGGGDTPRSRRQVELLGPATGLGLTDAERFGLDSFVQFSPSLRALLAQTAARPNADPRVVAANSIIAPWDGIADRDTMAMPLFATWVRGLERNSLGFSAASPPPPTAAFSNAAKNEAERAMIVAYQGMVNQYGTAAVPYGSLHTYSFGSVNSPVDGGDIGVETLFLTTCKNLPGSRSPVFYHPCVARGGSGFMFNVDMATGKFTVMRPVGDSDNPANPHYSDNAADFVANRYRDFPITRKAVDAERTSRQSLRFRPAKRTALGSRRLEVDGSGRARIELRCMLEDQRCKGRAKLTIKGRSSRRSDETIGEAKFSVQSLKTESLRIRLSPEAQRVLDQRGSLNARLELATKARSAKQQRTSTAVSLSD